MVSPTVNAPFFLIYNILILYQEGLLVNLVTLSQKGAKAWRGLGSGALYRSKGTFPPHSVSRWKGQGERIVV